jgi:acetolactate synthase I/II/III large subunit
LLIRHTQKNFCGGRLIGESPQNGVSFPSLKKIAKAYGLNYMKIAKLDDLNAKVEQLKEAKGAIICEIIMPEEQLLIPRVASRKLDNGSMVSMPYDDMFPFLPREEYLKNCLYKQ